MIIVHRERGEVPRGVGVRCLNQVTLECDKHWTLLVQPMEGKGWGYTPRFV